jgi:leucyl-tRNA synthetase
MQRDWIGKSVGAEVDFNVRPGGSILDTLLDAGLKPTVKASSIRVFTTRPDTLFGATYLVLAPEHPLVDKVTTPAQRMDVAAYKAQAAKKSDLERTELAKKKTGVFTGSHAVNPVNGEAIPIWIADYVLGTYGTGAIMAVPAHDDRDFLFARTFKLPIRPVVLPPKEWFERTDVFKTLLKMGVDPRFTAKNVVKPDDHAETILKCEADVLRKSVRLWESMDNDVYRMVEHLYRHSVELFTECFTDEGTAINSGSFNDLTTAEFQPQIIDWLEKQRHGSRKINYKLRDWLFSRQRYWGEPFPILHEVDASGIPTGVIETVPISELPLCLPELEDYKPSSSPLPLGEGSGVRVPEPPLGKAKAWLEVERNGKHYRRETNTMPQWAGSCWYYLRYLDPKNDTAFCDPAKLKQWLPVDLYVGGAEHAVLHLLYSRFWHKVLFDRGHVPCAEPFNRLVNQGMILGEPDYHLPAAVYEKNRTAIDSLGLQVIRLKDDEKEICILRNPVNNFERFSPLTEDQIVKEHGKTLLKGTTIELVGRADKMSKARGNVINPDDVVEQYGADSLRLYEMFMGPLEATKPWSMRGVEGVHRFLNRVWRLLIDDRLENVQLLETVQDIEPDKETKRILHQTIKRVSEDLETLSFNTAISAMMELTNHLTKQPVRSRSVLKTFVLLLSPFAPHLAEELWNSLGGTPTLAYEAWPSYDESLLKADTVEVPVQINGKLKAKLKVAADLSKEALEQAAMSDAKVKGLLEGKSIKKVIVVPGKLVNLVVG